MSAGTYDPLDLLTVAELAEKWKVHEHTVYGWIATGRLKSVALGRARRVPRAAAEEFVHANGRPSDCAGRPPEGDA